MSLASLFHGRARYPVGIEDRHRPNRLARIDLPQAFRLGKQIVEMAARVAVTDEEDAARREQRRGEIARAGLAEEAPAGAAQPAYGRVAVILDEDGSGTSGRMMPRARLLIEQDHARSVGEMGRYPGPRDARPDDRHLALGSFGHIFLHCIGPLKARPTKASPLPLILPQKPASQFLTHGILT
jgi:hypothetical protein